MQQEMQILTPSLSWQLFQIGYARDSKIRELCKLPFRETNPPKYRVGLIKSVPAKVSFSLQLAMELTTLCARQVN